MKTITKRCIKVSALCIASSFIVSLNPGTASANFVGEYSLAGVSLNLDNYNAALAILEGYDIQIANLDASDASTGYSNFAIADVSDYLNIRKEEGEGKAIIGKLPKNGSCTILELTQDGWAKIKTGKLTGYVKAEYLIKGEEAVALAKKVGTVVATTNTNGLNVREEASLIADIVTTVPIGETFEVIDTTSQFVKITIDQDTGYLARQYVDLYYQLPVGISTDTTTILGISTTRNNLINFAKKYLGGRYVWGGTTLGKGVDCSGFTQQVYKNFGISIPRTSREQARSGKTVTASTLKPGDLVFYGNSSGINHVAIFIGNGKVIHASTAKTGIKISNMNYRTPSKYVSYINN